MRNHGRGTSREINFGFVGGEIGGGGSKLKYVRASFERLIGIGSGPRVCFVKRNGSCGIGENFESGW